jgi:ubiquinone biosynthesis protein
MNRFAPRGLPQWHFWSRRHRRRQREITEILARHGFGALFSQFGLERYLKLSWRLMHKETVALAEASPARHLRLALEELGPTFVKIGQLLSTRPDLLPPDYVAELKQLQDNVPPVAWEAIEPIITAELGQPPDTRFASFDTTPLASASLGQVHAATLPDGADVVIKVQRPGIEPLIETDLEILLSLAGIAQRRNPWGELYNLVELADEFAAVIRGELDYRREARNAERFQANFASANYVHIPRVYQQYTTRRVLVMERLHGIKIDDVGALAAAGHDCRKVARRATRFVFKEILEDGFFHGDPHPGNYVVLPGTVIGVMDFGKVGYLDARNRINLTLLFIFLIQMDAPSIIEQMMRLGFVGQNIDRRELERDLTRLLRHYYGMPLHDIKIAELINALLSLVFRHQLRLPADFILLLQTLSMMEAAAIKLDPGYDIFAVSTPYVRRIQRKIWLRPEEWGPEALRSALALGDALIRFPQQAARLLNRLEQENVGLQVHAPDLPVLLHELSRIANQFTITLLTAAFILVVGWLVPQLDLTWPWNVATWLVIGAFAIVNLSGLWLLWRVIRSN